MGNIGSRQVRFEVLPGDLPTSEQPQRTESAADPRPALDVQVIGDGKRRDARAEPARS